ncbi:MAG: DoxX family protein [Planctomycetota bacterium]
MSGRTSGLEATGIALLRIVIGIVFVLHGWQKITVFGFDGTAKFMEGLGLPLPAVSAACAIAAEFGGGIALTLGLFTRFAAIPLAFTMVVAALSAHVSKGFFLPEGYEYTLVLFAACIAIACLGPGSASIDGLRARRRPAG